MLIGIDTSVIVGLLDSRDIWHTPAVGLRTAITTAKLEPVYFDCAMAEVISVLARRLRDKRREAEIPELLNRLLTDFPAEKLTWILPDVPRLYGEVMELIRSSAGELNFNDGLIALACRERQIQALASFDRDFDTVAWLTRVAVPDNVEALLNAAKEPPPDQN